MHLFDKKERENIFIKINKDMKQKALFLMLLAIKVFQLDGKSSFLNESLIKCKLSSIYLQVLTHAAEQSKKEIC